MAGYSWTISNGTITSGANAPIVTYTSGVSDSVMLQLTVTNAFGCAASTNAAIPINPPPSALISPNPAVVNANTPGNQADAPPGQTSYTWTIVNGVITSATNSQSITYVSGMTGAVTLGLTVGNGLGCNPASSTLLVPIQRPPLPLAGWSFRTNYYNSFTFSNGLGETTTGLTFDGTNYWSCSGGSHNGARFANYDTNGALISTNSPGLDFRSVFTDANGAVLARQYDDNIIYQQTAPGVFTPSGIALTGGNLDAQSAVVLNGAGTAYLAMSSGVVSRWDPDGDFLGTVNLQGFGAVSNENISPQNRGIAAFGNFWLTYNGAGLASVWDKFGNRLAEISLSGAGATSDSDYSFSYCNGKFFVVDGAKGVWRGYDIGSSGKVAILGAPVNSAWNTDVQDKLLGTGQFVQVDTYFLSGITPFFPTITNVQTYEAALVYSDASFNNSSNLGNALASYVSEGGGVTMATFAFDTAAGLGIQGNLVSEDDLPFSEGGQSSGSELTMIEDVPAHPIFTGVVSFDGGSASFLNSPITILNGGTQLAHWSSRQPLVGIKDIEPGRVAGLNFYPPSSDVRSDFWVASTDGARLMANSLLWAGKVPPIILAGPSNQISGVGGSANFQVNAAGLPPLTYQWRLNGSNISGATQSNLLFSVQNGASGQYTVVVSNAYGLALSQFATLASPLEFLPISLAADGTFSLTLGSFDGTPISANRAARVKIYTTTDLSLPLNQWTLLSNPADLSDGLLTVPGLAISAAQSYFQAVEQP
jgi:hypothetical protein